MAAPMDNFRRLYMLKSIFFRFSRNSDNIYNALLKKHASLHGIRQKVRGQAGRVGVLWKSCMMYVPVFATVRAIGWGPKATTSESSSASPEQKIIEEADRLYSLNQTMDLYDYLIQYKNFDNDEILWRLARATCDKGKLCAKVSMKEECMYEGFEYAKRALAINDDNYACHKWYAILLDYTGEYDGIKQRISNAYAVKEHFMKAAELNPTDATSIHSIGFWCFLFADMPWYQKTVASALFATPPTSTYEEALKYFQQAEDADPNFYSMNLLMLGKSYLRLKNYKMALHYLTKARDYPVVTPDDQRAHNEAFKLLIDLGLKPDQDK